MKKRLLTAAFSMILFGVIFTSCSKEKIQQNPTAQKTITSESNNARTTTESNSQSSSGSHSGGCNHGTGNPSDHYTGQ